jgi:hypothetical protein
MIKISSIRNIKPVADAISESSVEKLKQFTFSDLMRYKAVVSAFGALFALAFTKTFRKIAWLIGIFAGAGAMFMVWKFFLNKEED